MNKYLIRYHLINGEIFEEIATADELEDVITNVEENLDNTSVNIELTENHFILIRKESVVYYEIIGGNATTQP